jgi:mono/diheme cytochrome c family protein
MMKIRFGTIVFLTLLSGALPLRAQDGGDAQKGLGLAGQVCSECHAVQAQQPRPANPPAPTFAELAATPGMTATALTVALTTPHAGMPMFKLTPEQRTDVIAYILSLRKDGSTPGK